MTITKINALEEELTALKNQVANLKAEHAATMAEHDNEARLYRATIANLRDEIAHLTTLAEGRDKALSQVIAQRDRLSVMVNEINEILNAKGDAC